MVLGHTKIQQRPHEVFDNYRTDQNIQNSEVIHCKNDSLEEELCPPKLPLKTVFKYPIKSSLDHDHSAQSYKVPLNISEPSNSLKKLKPNTYQIEDSPIMPTDVLDQNSIHPIKESSSYFGNQGMLGNISET